MTAGQAFALPQRVGATGLWIAAQVGGMAVLVGRAARALVPPHVFELEFREVVRAMERFGVQSVPVVVATAMFTGGIMVIQALPYVNLLQAQALLPWAAGFATLREVAPVLIGLMFSGRCGSNNTAELGTMAVTEQVDALRILALDPFALLVLPRLIAMTTMMLCLTLLGDVCALVGGMWTARALTGMETDRFVLTLLRSVTFADFFSGVVKATVFGGTIGVVSCHFGLTTRGGAVGVGKSVNASVVASAVAIVVSDYFLTGILR